MCRWEIWKHMHLHMRACACAACAHVHVHVLPLPNPNTETLKPWHQNITSLQSQGKLHAIAEATTILKTVVLFCLLSPCLLSICDQATHIYTLLHTQNSLSPSCVYSRTHTHTLCPSPSPSDAINGGRNKLGAWAFCYTALRFGVWFLGSVLVCFSRLWSTRLVAGGLGFRV